MDRRSTAALLTVKEVADRLKVSDSTVDRWIKQGDLKARDLHAGQMQRRLIRILEEDLEAFINRGMIVIPHRPYRPRRKPPKQYF